MADHDPDAVVVVATVRALKYNGGVPKAELTTENLEALEAGLPNLLRHVSNIRDVYGLPCVVAINAFPTDTEAELKLVEEKCHELGVNVALSEVWAKGGAGGESLAREVMRLCEEPHTFHFSYETGSSVEDALEAVATKTTTPTVWITRRQPRSSSLQLKATGFGNLPVCIAKTQYSFTDDQHVLGAPEGFRITVRNLKVSGRRWFCGGATGDIMTMPGSAQGTCCREDRRAGRRHHRRPLLVSVCSNPDELFCGYVAGGSSGFCAHETCQVKDEIV